MTRICVGLPYFCYSYADGADCGRCRFAMPFVANGNAVARLRQGDRWRLVWRKMPFRRALRLPQCSFPIRFALCSRPLPPCGLLEGRLPQGGCFSENLLLCFRGSGYAPEQSTPEESESADVCIKRMLSVEDALAGWDFVNRNVFPLSEICMMRTNNSPER